MAITKHDIDHNETVKGLVYRVAKTERDIERVTDFYFDIFFEGEPGSKSHGGYKGVRHPNMVKQINEVLLDGVSVMCVEPDTDFLVGIRTSFAITRKEAKELKRETPEELLSRFPKTHAMIMYILDEVVSIPDVFEKNKDIDKLLDMWALSTHPDYRGRGIASELIRQAFKVAKKAGCQAAVVAATHDHSKRIFDRIGMTQISQRRWKDMKVNGEVHFDNVEYEYMTGHLIKL